MDLGVSLPTSGDLASPANIARIAQEAEQLGYTALWTYERLLRPVDADGQQVPEGYRLVYDPLETLSYVAALTSVVKLGTSVMDALFHPPVVLARRYATLDQFSGGRVIAGLGQGWMAQEFEAANVPLSRQGAGMDEVIAAMRACWGPDPVSYQGRYQRIAASQINPKPVQRHLPVLMGSMTPGGIRRAARIADGLNPIAISADALRAMVTSFREEAKAAGRDPASLTVAVRANVPMTAQPLDGDRPYLGGSAAQIAEDLAGLADLDVDHVLFSDVASTDIAEMARRLGELQAAVRR